MFGGHVSGSERAESLCRGAERQPGPRAERGLGTPLVLVHVELQPKTKYDVPLCNLVDWAGCV